MADFAPTLIFVPGIRPKPPAEQQQAQLRRCLQSAAAKSGASEELAVSMADNFQLVGWSHQFYGEHAEISPDVPGIERLLAGQDSRQEDRKQAASLESHFTALFYDIGDRFPLLTRMFATRRMETRVAEIHSYFADQAGRATEARLMVAEALQSAWDRGSPVILVGHSFGSVIAWDTLWELSRLEGNPGNVDLFLTMGSPLTMQYIRGQLKGARQSRAERYPENISRWINVAAVGEVTALGRKMSNLFGDMVTLGLTESISDNLETVNQFHGPFGLNPHKCYGYMASQEVAQILLAEFSRGAST